MFWGLMLCVPFAPELQAQSTDPLQPNLFKTSYTLEVAYMSADGVWLVTVECKDESDDRRVTLTPKGSKKAAYVLTGVATGDFSYRFEKKKKNILVTIDEKNLMTLKDGDKETQHVLVVTNRPMQGRHSVKIQR